MLISVQSWARLYKMSENEIGQTRPKFNQNKLLLYFLARLTFVMPSTFFFITFILFVGGARFQSELLEHTLLKICFHWGLLTLCGWLDPNHLHLLMSEWILSPIYWRKVHKGLFSNAEIVFYIITHFNYLSKKKLCFIFPILCWREMLSNLFPPFPTITLYSFGASFSFSVSWINSIVFCSILFYFLVQ